MNFLKTGFLFFFILIISSELNAQFTAYSGGLLFSSGVDYNSGTTGNPGLFGKAYFKINNRFNVVPALAAYNKYKKSDFSKVLKNYMFQGDIDGVYSLYKDKAMRLVGFGGFNVTTIISKWEILQEDPSLELNNSSDIKPGFNIGLALQLYVNSSFDAYISTKYIFSSFNQLVINAGAIYYIGGKRRRGAW
jgi:hypothetical protein